MSNVGADRWGPACHWAAVVEVDGHGSRDIRSWASIRGGRGYGR